MKCMVSEKKKPHPSWFARQEVQTILTYKIDVFSIRLV
jgi:hypothetical protein